MNILYLSKLIEKKGSGPYYSIPGQVSAQKEFDNVFWYNLNEAQSEDWSIRADVKTCLEYPEMRLGSLPAPFDYPDLVVVEEQYEFFNSKIVRDIQRRRIPYIIVPRCSLTASAQKKRRLKKSVGNFIYFNKFIRKAAAIQYLTEGEKIESTDKWNSNSFVIPNGIACRSSVKTFHDHRIECVFIGRIDIYHKGLDLLLSACSQISPELKAANVRISIYGDGNCRDISTVNTMIESKRLSDIVFLRGPVYEKQKETILDNSDVFILTSRFEGLPMGVLEALSYGLPVLITQGTNMCDAIDKHHAGWTDATTVDGVKSSLLKMIADKWKYPELSMNAMQLSREYSWSAIARKSHQIYQEIIQRTKNESNI